VVYGGDVKVSRKAGMKFDDFRIRDEISRFPVAGAGLGVFNRGTFQAPFLPSTRSTRRFSAFRLRIPDGNTVFATRASVSSIVLS
jgi:hypothetical protein